MSDPRPAATSADTVVDIRWADLLRLGPGGRRLGWSGGLSGGLLGLLWAFLLPNQYTAQVVLMPELPTKTPAGLSSLGNLAGLAGINLDNLTTGTDALRPDLYPNIVQSVPFVLYLLQQPVYPTESAGPVPYGLYLERREAETIAGRLTNWLPGNGNAETALPGSKGIAKLLNISRKKEDQVLAVNKTVTAGFDKKTGLVTLVSIQNDPVVAATIARLSADYLTSYVTNYRTEKARQQVRFLARQLAEARQRYRQTEYALSAWRDRNQNLFLSTAKLEGQRLQADYTLAQTLFDDLSRQYEQARVRVQQETPVFKTLEPARIPTRKSGPKRTMLIGGLAVLGLLAGFGLAVLRRLQTLAGLADKRAD